ncbi:Origin recognition complex subunit 3 [Geranomyces variabilis]|nr:Origin recognition complex subunit 3 [Geranomyces variabilis]
MPPRAPENSEPLVHDDDDTGVCLLPAPGTAGSKGSRGRLKGGPVGSEEEFQRLYLGREPAHLCTRRAQVLRRLLAWMEKKVENILGTLNGEAIDQIVGFVASAHSEFRPKKSLHEDEPPRVPEPLDGEYRELPTGLVFAGINPQDHDRLFAQVRNRLETSADIADCVVATLPAARCANIKSASRYLIEQFLGTHSFLDDESVEDIPTRTDFSLECNAKLPNYDLQRLTGWHQRIGGQKTLVVILPDFESFDSSVLETLLSILSILHRKVPFVLLFGVATSIDIVYQSLSRENWNSLRIEKFKSQQSQECVNAIVEEIIMRHPVCVDGAPASFKFGLDSFRFLMDNFQLHTLSVLSVQHALKYAMMDMFYSNPLSVLMDATSEQTKDDIVASLTTDHLLDVRMTRSFRNHINIVLDDNPEAAAALLLDDDALRLWIRDALAYLDRYHVRYHAAMQCVVELQNLINSPTIRRAGRNLHLLGLQGEMIESEYMKMLFQLLRKRKPASINDFLLACTKRLTVDATTSAAFASETATIAALQTELASFASSDSESSSDDSGDDGGIREIRESRKRARGKRTTNVSKRLKPIVEQVKAGTLEACVKKIVDFVRDLFADALKSYTDVPLHEAMYYSNEGRLKKAFHPQPRAAIQTALGQTQHYLPCTCCPPGISLNDTISPHLNDASVAYRLYLECGRLINLYDWFVAFGAILEKDGDGQLAVVAAESEEDRRLGIQARFVNAIAELQYLGFVKHTARKTDHVVRLTWGNV